MPSRLPAAIVVIALVTAAPAWSADAMAEADATETQPRVIDAADAAEYIGEECVVEMVVRAARALADKDVCFLNSLKSYRDEANFTVVVFKDGLARFRDAGIENPALHFLDERIRVRGVIATHRDRPQIVITDPDQIEVVAKSTTSDDATSEDTTAAD